jgi:hypothetical protein
MTGWRSGAPRSRSSIAEGQISLPRTDCAAFSSDKPKLHFILRDHHYEEAKLPRSDIIKDQKLKRHMP